MTVREIALSLLMEYENEGKYVNLSLSSHKADSLNAKDRAFLTVLLYTTVERKITYDYIIAALAKRPAEKLSSHTLNILRLGLCQIMHIASVPDFAATNETVKLAKNKGERALVNAILREAVRVKENLPLPDRNKNTARYLSVLYSFPPDTVKHFIALLGKEEAERLLLKFNELAPTSLSVNTRRISRSDFLGLLLENGIEAAAAKSSSIGVKIPASINPCEIPGYKEGLFFVQDEASAIAVEALGTSKDDTLIDVCSCPGGKSFAAAILSGGARIYSFDLHESKLSLVKSGADRLGLKLNVRTLDALTPDEALFGTVDKLICDVPCSGLGVLAKKPDLRHKPLERDGQLPALQLEILTKSSAYLKPGGEMIYSTCTLNPRENEEVVRAFLDSHEDFELVDFCVGGLCSDGGMLTLYPHIHKTDGFFVAKIKHTGGSL